MESELQNYIQKFKTTAFSASLIQSEYNSSKSKEDKISIISEINAPMHIDSASVYKKNPETTVDFGLPTFKQFCEIYEDSDQDDGVSKSLQKIKMQHQLDSIHKKEIRYFDQYFKDYENVEVTQMDKDFGQFSEKVDLIFEKKKQPNVVKYDVNKYMPQQTTIFETKFEIKSDFREPEHIPVSSTSSTFIQKREPSIEYKKNFEVTNLDPKHVKFSAYSKKPIVEKQELEKNYIKDLAKKYGGTQNDNSILNNSQPSFSAFHSSKELGIKQLLGNERNKGFKTMNTYQQDQSNNDKSDEKDVKDSSVDNLENQINQML